MSRVTTSQNPCSESKASLYCLGSSLIEASSREYGMNNKKMQNNAA